MIDPKLALDVINHLKNDRLRFEPDWYRSYYAYENNTFVGYERVTQTITKMPYRKRFFINLPETKKQADAFENLLLMFLPLFVVYPTNISDQKQRDFARNISKLLRQQYLDWDSENVIHEFVHLAIKYPVSFFEIGIENQMNDETGKLEKALKPTIADAFDYLFDPRIPFEDNPIIVKIIRKSLKTIKEFKEFKAPVVNSTNIAVDLKELIHDNKYGFRTSIGDYQTVICYQVMEKTADGIDMQIIDISGNVLKKKRYKGARFYPVVPLSLSSGDIYSPSYVQNMIPINRSISLIANRIEDFILKFVKGAYLIREGSDVIFSDENGIKVFFDGEEPRVLDIPQLPPAIFNWFHELFNLAERYGVNSVAMGGTPKGSQMRAGKMMDSAVKNQQLQQKTPLDNLKQAFKQIAERTIFYLSEITHEPTTFSFRSSGQNDFEQATFIGQKYQSLAPDATPIPFSVKALDVEIEDVAAATMDAKKKDLLELAKEFANLPGPFKRILLDMYKVGPTADIMEEVTKDMTLLDAPEFQAMIEQARSGGLPPEVTQGLVVLLKFLSQQSPVPSTEKAGVPNIKGPGGQPAPLGMTPPPAPAPAGQPGRPPQKPSADQNAG
jgi:hypothetical protein